MRDEKEERKKQARSNKQTRQSNTAHPRQSLFLEKMSCLRWDSMHMYIHMYLQGKRLVAIYSKDAIHYLYICFLERSLDGTYFLECNYGCKLKGFYMYLTSMIYSSWYMYNIIRE